MPDTTTSSPSISSGRIAPERRRSALICERRLGRALLSVRTRERARDVERVEFQSHPRACEQAGRQKPERGLRERILKGEGHVRLNRVSSLYATPGQPLCDEERELQ